MRRRLVTERQCNAAREPQPYLERPPSLLGELGLEGLDRAVLHGGSVAQPLSAVRRGGWLPTTSPAMPYACAPARRAACRRLARRRGPVPDPRAGTEAKEESAEIQRYCLLAVRTLTRESEGALLLKSY